MKKAMRWPHFCIISILIMSAAVSLQAQCFPDRHSTSWFDAWVSCEMSENPNSHHGKSHWIMYDLSKVYELGGGHFWNINDPAHLDQGIRRAFVDLSMDGVHWTFFDTLVLSKGAGLPEYEGEDAIDLAGAIGRFVLLTVIDTYGDGQCAGFSELRVEREEWTTSVFDVVSDLNRCIEMDALPNPFSGQTKVTIRSTCAAEGTWSLTSVLGQTVAQGSLSQLDRGREVAIGQNVLCTGQYVLTVDIGEERKSIVLNKL